MNPWSSAEYDPYDDPMVEDHWCEERRSQVSEYLAREGLVHGRIGEWPAWHVVPIISVWAIESVKRPEWVGWWAICGDCPTDYESADTIKHPREALRAFGLRWSELAQYMERGEEHPSTKIGSPGMWPVLFPILKSRANALLEWAADDTLWEGQDM